MPRTFIGSVVLAWLAKLAMPVAQITGHLSDKFDIQILGTCSVFAFVDASKCILSPRSSHALQYYRLCAPKTRRVASIWRAVRCFVRFADMYAVPFAILDEQDTAEHVRAASWYVIVVLVTHGSAFH